LKKVSKAFTHSLMKAIMLMFDSLNRHLLPPYGCDWVHAPNFSRLAQRSVRFDNSYVCSMPCMPARRDLHTGRPNFLHSPWGPLQPWDDSLPALLSQGGVSSHLITDHYHYFEDGGATYHPRYDSWQFFRGQEGDPWIGQVADPLVPPNRNVISRRQDWVNRQFLRTEADWPQVQTVNAGLDFIERNRDSDSWFLQIETFDPHEPFVAPPSDQKHYAGAGREPLFDWPGYRDVSETAEEVEQARHNYAALVSLCDRSLGRVLDAMDRHAMWDDTMLIVWTDHGFLLGEHNRWAKNIPTLWNEVARTPFFVWDPRSGHAGSARQALVQPAIDLAPTLLRFFGQEPTSDMTGQDLDPVLRDDAAVREGAIFGYFGMPIHVTDGRYLAILGVTDRKVAFHAYTWMPTEMRNFLHRNCLEAAELVEGLPFMKGLRVPRVPWQIRCAEHPPRLLFDLQTDPGQMHPLNDPEILASLESMAVTLARKAYAPDEILAPFGLVNPVA
jgi:arylsulfatase A-like enzyme